MIKAATKELWNVSGDPELYGNLLRKLIIHVVNNGTDISTFRNCFIAAVENTLDAHLDVLFRSKLPAVNFNLQKLDVNFVHREHGLSIENNIKGIQLKSTKSESIEDVRKSTRLDFQPEFSERNSCTTLIVNHD
ncbi:uncharacterized protein LOC131644448 [Vicia villosa]|uniref:uncharacterized protein LOC131644448 n=1 Tax=Vicia villosa TaxID=3911 RepID=UPI00273C3AAE|nr:uncharacterized protein LOC131644448 [Vicia villosa]XP_058770936.1 uncharacterized protein LOC131644448 [Vicia villosa]